MPLLVVGVAALGRKLRLLRAVEVGELPRDHVAVLELVGVGQGLEEPPAHDLEAFLGARRAPGRFDAPDHVAQPVEGLAPALPPTSTSLARGCAASPEVSDAGRLITSRQFFASLADSVRPGRS
jgi:hypothetical protein